MYCGLVVREQLAQHRHEPVDGVGRLAVGAGQPADRVVRAIHLVAAVDEEQGAAPAWAERQLYHPAPPTKRRVRRRGHDRRSVMRVWGVCCAVALIGWLRRESALAQVRVRRGHLPRLDGSATVYVNAAVPALVALRGVDLPLDPKAPARSPGGARRSSKHRPRTWQRHASRRDDRRYVHLRVDVDDIRRLSGIADVRVVRLSLRRRGDAAEYAQKVGAAAGPRGRRGRVEGQELAAFRLHLPSRVVVSQRAFARSGAATSSSGSSRWRIG